MKIVIDCRFISASGLGTYLKGCLPYFLSSPHKFILVGDTEKLHCFVAGKSNYEIINCSIKPFSLNELFLFPDSLKKIINSADLYYSPYFNIPSGINVPVYTTIHDIIFPDVPELTSKVGLTARMWFYKRAFKLSKKIFTVSNFSKSRIEHYSHKKVPIIVTYIALQSYLLTKRELPVVKKDMILFIGNIKKHKGLDCLFEAFLLARAEGLLHKLIIVGSRDNFRTTDNSFLQKIDSIAPDSVTFTGFISDDKLSEYLSEASLLVQPSLYEGFGLPPLEAMVSGTYALISDIPVFKEIYDGFPVTFFRAGDVNDLKEKLLDILLDKSARTLSLSEDLVNKYNFQKTSEIILRNLSLDFSE